MGGVARGVDQSRALEPGRVPARVAAGLAALSDRASAAYQAALAAALPARALGVGAGLAAGALMWQSFWHDLVAWDVAVLASTAVAAAMLALPFRALAGAFASTLGLAGAAMAATYFITSPAAVTAGGPIAEDVLANQQSSAQIGPTQIGGVGMDSVGDAEPVPAAAEPRFGHVVVEVPDATRPRWEPATPCSSRPRAGPGRDDTRSAAGPCERATGSRSRAGQPR